MNKLSTAVFVGVAAVVAANFSCSKFLPLYGKRT